MQNSSPIKNYGSASWLSQENNIQTSGNDISPQINSVCLLTISEEEREESELSESIKFGGDRTTTQVIELFCSIVGSFKLCGENSTKVEYRFSTKT